MWNGLQVIAEVKTESPFGYKSAHSWDDLFKIANKIGDIISIHTDPRWGGSFQILKKAREMTNKPILAKGIHLHDEDIAKCLEIGADYALVVGRIPNFPKEKLLIEQYSLTDLEKIPNVYKAVWNSRDLADGGLKKETFAQARAVFPGWLCQASNIRTPDDIDRSANAVLIGSNLVEFSELI